MQITGIGNGEYGLQNLSLKIGQRVFVQVLSVGDKGYGKVLLDGQEFTAKLEISAQPGQKLWGQIQEISQNEIILAKQSQLEERQMELRASPGLGTYTGPIEADPELKLLLEDFPRSPEKLSRVISDIGKDAEENPDWPDYRREIPRWLELRGDKPAQILYFLKKLGLNYEQRFLQACKLPDELREKEFDDLKNTLKGRILAALDNDKLSEPVQTQLKKVLHSLAGQQLWLPKDSGDNIFVLLNLPLYEAGKVYDIRIAAEGPRKGNKLDREHFHIGVFTETLTLGEIGVESWIHEDQIFLKVFSGQTDILRAFSAGILPQTREGFAKLGFSLQEIEFANWEYGDFFRAFLDGKSQSGVDILK